eukprot:8243603-Alexandrium_andersonii.AAC.1
MSGGVPEVPPGLEQRESRAKLSRSAGAAPASRTSPISPSASTAPTSFGPPGAAGSRRRAPEGLAQQPNPADRELARLDGRLSGEAGWQGGLAAAFSRSASAAGRAGSARGSGSRDPRQ